MKILRIVFCVLSCLCLAAAVPIGIFCNLIYLVLDLFVALGFGAAMLFCKGKSDEEPPQKDFMDDDVLPQDKPDGKNDETK